MTRCYRMELVDREVGAGDQLHCNLATQAHCSNLQL